MRRDQTKHYLYNKNFVNYNREDIPIKKIKSVKPHQKSYKSVNPEMGKPRKSSITCKENANINKIFSGVKLPKINFSLITAYPSQFHILKSFKPQFELREENMKQKVSNIYESIFLMKKSLSLPKLYLDDSFYNTPKENEQSKRFLREVKLNQEANVADMLKSLPDLVNARDSIGKTPLHWAVIRNNILIAKLLLKFGADVNAQDYSKRTPIDLALIQNYQNMINLLNNS